LPGLHKSTRPVSIPFQRIKHGPGIAPRDLRKNRKDSMTEMAGLLQVEKPAPLSAFDGSGLNPQVCESKPVIYPKLDFGRYRHNPSHSAQSMRVYYLPVLPKTELTSLL